jgi:antitoxin component of MazEF toxin-antitoxin module
MRAKIKRIGDQFGLMLPSEVVRACGFGAEATVTVHDRKLVVTASQSEPRQGWAEALRAVPQEELDKDHAELQSFRETPHR